MVWLVAIGGLIFCIWLMVISPAFRGVMLILIAIVGVGIFYLIRQSNDDDVGVDVRVPPGQLRAFNEYVYLTNLPTIHTCRGFTKSAPLKPACLDRGSVDPVAASDRCIMDVVAVSGVSADIVADCKEPPRSPGGRKIEQ